MKILKKYSNGGKTIQSKRDIKMGGSTFSVSKEKGGKKKTFSKNIGISTPKHLGGTGRTEKFYKTVEKEGKEPKRKEISERKYVRKSKRYNKKLGKSKNITSSSAHRGRSSTRTGTFENGGVEPNGKMMKSERRALRSKQGKRFDKKFAKKRKQYEKDVKKGRTQEAPHERTFKFRKKGESVFKPRGKYTVEHGEEKQEREERKRKDKYRNMEEHDSVPEKPATEETPQRGERGRTKFENGGVTDDKAVRRNRIRNRRRKKREERRSERIANRKSTM